jgi:hypothetical protein
MTAQPFRPPEVSWPTPWQRDQVAAHLAGSLPELAARLNRLAAGCVEIDALSIEPVSPGASADPTATPELAASLVAAALGHVTVPSLDLAAPAEAAVFSLILSTVRGWAEAHLPSFGSAGRADVRFAVALRCLSTKGIIELPGRWETVWAAVRPGLGRPSRPPDVPVASAIATIEAVLAGPEVTAAAVLGLKAGDVLFMPVGQNGRVCLRAGAVCLGTATLGARDGCLAARIDEIMGRDHRDVRR